MSPLPMFTLQIHTSYATYQQDFFKMFNIFKLITHCSPSPLLSSSLHPSPLHHFSLARIQTLPASKATRGSGWVATSFSFPLMLSSHSAVACSVRAEWTPGSPPEASARRSPPLPAHLREALEWSTIVLAVIWWPRSSSRHRAWGSSTSLDSHITAYKIKFSKHWVII